MKRVAVSPLIQTKRESLFSFDSANSFFSEGDAPSVADTEVSFDAFSDSVSLGGESVASVRTRLPLQWKFKGLTLWVEFEEFEGDLTTAIQDAALYYGTEVIPKPHATAIYGMEHLTSKEAKAKLQLIPSILPDGKWPYMEHPVAIKQDVAQEPYRPGQVCSISWAELTLPTNVEHEAALDALYHLFEMPTRQGPWTPHISLAYDNPDDSILDLGDTVAYASRHPSLLAKNRRVEAISLWDTNGKLGDWKQLDRIQFGE